MRAEVKIKLEKRSLAGFGPKVSVTPADVEASLFDFAERAGATIINDEFDAETNVLTAIVTTGSNLTGNVSLEDAVEGSRSAVMTIAQKIGVNLPEDATPRPVGFPLLFVGITGIVLIGLLATRWTVVAVKELTDSATDFVNSDAVKIAVTIGALFLFSRLINRWMG